MGRLQIIHVPARYTYAIGSGRWDDLDEVFTPDAGDGRPSRELVKGQT